MNAAALRAGALAFALLAAWRIVQVNFVLYDADGAPRPPEAPSVASSAEADELPTVRAVLHANPGDIDALLFIARHNEAAGNAREARRAYDAAFDLAPMDREVLASGAAYFLRQGSTAEAIALLDRLVDSFPDARAEAFPTLSRLLAQGTEPKAWAAIRARGPAWLGPFIVSSCEKGTDPALLVPIFLERVKAGRATADETGCVVDKLRDSDRVQQAYQVWLNTLPRERMADVGHVYNGSFEYAASGVGFDWRPTRGKDRDVGHTVEMPQAAGVSGKRALRVTYSGKRQAGVPIAQYLALAPGRYEMSGLARPQSITAGRGAQWTIRCLAEGRPGEAIAASERFVGSSEWRRFAFEILVPPDCAGQLVQLEAVGEGAIYLAGTAWFDELVLRQRR